MSKTYKIFTNKFSLNQRVRNVKTNQIGYIIEVDPNSFNPPKGIAIHNPYKVIYEDRISWWEPENELENI